MSAPLTAIIRPFLGARIIRGAVRGHGGCSFIRHDAKTPGCGLLDSVLLRARTWFVCELHGAGFDSLVQ